LSRQQELSTEQYLARSHIATYFQDAIERMLECKAQGIKVDAHAFFHDYFRSVYEGTNTLFREYTYIHATPRNRSSFIRNFYTTFKHVGDDGDLLLRNDYDSLLRVVCRDFDYALVEKTANVVLMEDASDCVINFSDFVYAFQLQFYYEEFCEVCLKLFGRVHIEGSNSELPVAEPAWCPNGSNGANNSLKSESVSAAQFFRYIRQELYVKPPDFSIPDEDVLVGVLNGFTKITYYGFMSALGKCGKLVKSIGALPPLTSSASSS